MVTMVAVIVVAAVLSTWLHHHRWSSSDYLRRGMVVMPAMAATATRVSWDVNYARIGRLAVIIAARGVLSWVVTMPMRAMAVRAGGINDGLTGVLRVVRAL